MITNPTAWPLIVWVWLGTAATFLGLAVWCRSCTSPGSAAFRGMILANVIYVGGSALELITPSEQTWYWISGFMYCGIGLIGPCLALLFADVTGRNQWFTPLCRRAMILGGLVIGGLRFTDPWSGWIYRSCEPLQENGLYLHHFTPGPGFLLLQSLMMGAMVLGIVLVGMTWSEAGRLLRWHMLLLVIACLFPITASTLFAFGLSPWGWLDPTPAATLVATAITAWAIYQHRLVHVAPIARSSLLEHLGDGVLVTDNSRAVVDLNPSALRLLELDERSAIGRPLASVLGHRLALAELCGTDHVVRGEIRLSTQEPGYLQAAWYPLYGGVDRTRQGFMLVVSDITLRKQAEQQLHELLATRTRDWKLATAAALRASEQEQHRLGNMLHDTLCQDLIGFRRTADTLAAEIGQPAAEQLRAHGAQIADSGRRARDLAHLLAGPDLEDLSFEEALHSTVEQLGRSLGLVCELTLASNFPPIPPEPAGHLLRIIREAVSNAARHARAQNVWIDLLAGTGGTATVAIANDGTPPPTTPLAEGLGWRQMRMRAALLGGTISIKPGPTSGAIVELFLPAPTP